MVIEEIKTKPPPIRLFHTIKALPYSFFLDSAADYKKLGRFSFLGCDPFLIFKSKRDAISLEWQDGKSEHFKSNPFYALKEIFKIYEISNVDTGLPFVSGGVGYLAYDMKDFTEGLPDRAVDDLNLPDCIFALYDTVVIYDNQKGKAYIASSGLPEMDPVKNSRRAKARLKEFKTRLAEQSVLHAYRNKIPPASLKSNFSKTSYMKAIEKAKEYIKNGDIYQVNLSQRFEAELNMEPFELYLRLRDYSPAPFSAYLSFGDVTILSSSPERFLLKKQCYIETRPIKGTRPRGNDAFSDALLEKELLQSRKDRAEHIMIVDLERNDLGRICEYGSVFPSEFIILERYATVFHLVSTVAGRLKKEIDPVDCLLAAFPGGSITGAPKIRAMEIIEELEPVKRSIYTGAIGYISFDGNMDTSIVIRTFVIKGKRIYFQVGGGIVADSDPKEEYDETLDKAKGLMLSLGIGLERKEMVGI
ncbi:MAG: aminodeoxychorismate synthase component I [Candidatus Omnitrophica bacterium]|nr:aminodeoxychorismate synthase component I [Candidatus Omnitrophota bacterium]